MVLVCPFVCPPVVLVCPLVVLVCPLVVSVCPIVVLVVLSVGLVTTDPLFMFIITGVKIYKFLSKIMRK